MRHRLPDAGSGGDRGTDQRLKCCPAYACPLTPDAVAGIRIRSDLVLQHHEDNLRAREESGQDPDLERTKRDLTKALGFMMISLTGRGHGDNLGSVNGGGDIMTFSQV